MTQFLADPAGWLAVNLLNIVIGLTILVVGIFVSRMAATLVRRTAGLDRTFTPLLAQIVQYGILLVAIITSLDYLGVPSTSVLAVLGAAGLAIALALQGTLANIAAGIMLIWLRPIAVGEYVTGDGVAGIVVEVGLFGTRLRSTTGLFIWTPNSKLWSSVITNHSRDPMRRIDVNITVPETANIARVRKAMLRAATADKAVLDSPEPSAHVESFAGDKVVLQLRAWVATPAYLASLHGLTEAAKVAVNKELAAQAAGPAEISNPTDPHVQGTGQNTA